MLIRKDKENIVIIVDADEQVLVAGLIGQIAKLPPTPCDVSRENGREDDAYLERQEMLDSSMKEQREKLQAAALQWSNPANWVKEGKQVSLTLNPEKTEQFLCLLNDLRMGSWHLLGTPEDVGKVKKTRNNLPYLGLFHLGGWMQEMILDLIYA